MTAKQDTRREDLLAALSEYDYGEGCLGIIVDQALEDDPNVTEEEVREICREAYEYAKAEADWQRRPVPSWED